MYYGSNILFIVAMGLSKITVVQFLLQLTANPPQRRVFYSALGVISIWTFASLFALALQCDLSHPWLLVGQKCSAVVCNASPSRQQWPMRSLTTPGFTVAAMASHMWV